MFQYLRIGITQHEIHVTNPLPVHVFHGITATTSDSDHFNNRGSNLKLVKIYQSVYHDRPLLHL